MTNDQDFSGFAGNDNQSDVSVRPVRARFGRGSDDAAPAHSTRPVDWSDRARMQRVCAAKPGVEANPRNLDRGTRRVGRRGPGAIFRYDSASGTRFYASIVRQGQSTRLGTFSDLSLAEQAIDAYLAAVPMTEAEITEEFVTEVVNAVTLEERHRCFAARRDPISDAVLGLGLRLTFDQVARLYGVSRQRIEQLESRGLHLLKSQMKEYQELTERDPGIWDQIETME